MDKSRLVYLLAGILILGALAYYIATSSRPSAISVSIPSSGYPVLVELTDPPEVPNGTTSLSMSYSGVAVYYSTNSVPVTVSSNASGTVDLLSLLNISKTLASVYVPANSLISKLRFNVTRVSIQIGSNTFPVALPNSSIIVHVKGAVNSSSTILADLSPTVVTIITNTTPVFVMVPSVKAVIVPGINQTAKVTGYAPLNLTLKQKLEQAKPNITITKASISSVGNDTSIRISLANNGNSSVVIRSVLIFGNESMRMFFNFSNPLGKFLGKGALRQPIPVMGMNTSVISTAANSIGSIINSTHGASLPFYNGLPVNASTISKGIATARQMLNGMEFNETEIGEMVNEAEHSRVFNASAMQDILRNITHNSSLSIPALSHMNYSQIEDLLNKTVMEHRMVKEHEHFRVINFLVSRNGTLVAPFDQLQAMSDYYVGGFALAPHSAATLNFSGELRIGNSSIILTFNSGEIYKVVVVGEEGARASTNITAS